jgi:hypothetical protein
MPEAFLIGVDTDALDRSYRRLFLVLTDHQLQAVEAVKRMHPSSKVDWTGIKALPVTVKKLGLQPGVSHQL